MNIKYSMINILKLMNSAELGSRPKIAFSCILSVIHFFDAGKQQIPMTDVVKMVNENTDVKIDDKNFHHAIRDLVAAELINKIIYDTHGNMCERARRGTTSYLAPTTKLLELLGGSL